MTLNFIQSRTRFKLTIMAYTKEDLEYEDLKRQEWLEEQEREEFENYLRLKAKYEGKSED